MRSCVIELSGREFSVVKDTLERLRSTPDMAKEEVEVRVRDLEKILFGFGEERR